jgi:hypothetical protein
LSELDKAMRAVERHGYRVRLARIAAGGDFEDGMCGYGTGEVPGGRGARERPPRRTLFRSSDAEGGPSIDHVT